MGEYKFFATTAKGVEEVLAAELRGLGIANAVVETGGVRFSGDLAAAYRANLHLRTASRVLLQLAEFPCDSPQSLYDGVRTIPWADYLTPAMTLAVDCNLRDSAITHSGYAALKTKDAIVDQLREQCGSRPNVNPHDPDLLVNVHLFRNRCTISLDTSGSPLDRRGYRLERNEAPLRETLAAALIELTGWDCSMPLIDPMCGSGTIVIEAALKASRCAPGLLRSGFGFQRWPGYEQILWKTLVREARAQVLEQPAAPIMGYDLAVRAVEIAKGNSVRADVADMVSFNVGDIADFTPPPAPGVLLFNPPYGQRLGEEELLKALYKKIGDVMKQRCRGYTAYLFTGNLDLAKCVGLKASRRIVLFNGPIECRLLKYELY
jgi:putative N6-adenine-specific DNA methylase